MGQVIEHGLVTLGQELASWGQGLAALGQELVAFD